MSVAAAGARAARPATLDRVIAALPLVTVFSWLVLVYAWQAWLVTTPTIFPDEIEYTHLARSVADTGSATLRGEPVGWASLAAVARAPAWLLGDTAAAFLASKLLGVLAMTAAMFPTYALARLLVGPRPALFAAAAAAMTPALAFSSVLMEEAFAYPAAALALYLVVRALAVPTVTSVGLAAGAAVAAPLVRGQLIVIPVVFALSAAALAWTSARGRAVRARWRPWDSVALVLGAMVAAFAADRVLTRGSVIWRVVREHDASALDFALVAGGAFTIGVGVLPVLAALAALVPARGEAASSARRAFAAVFVFAGLAFGLYAGVKGAYLSTFYAPLALERNLIYLAPLVFVGMAAWLALPRVRLLAVAGAALVTVVLLRETWIVVKTPYFEAPGYALVSAAHRHLGLAPETMRQGFYAVLLAGVLLLVLPLLLRARPAALATVAAVAAGVVLAWNFAGQIAAAQAQRVFSEQLLEIVPAPLDWIDRTTGGDTAAYLGQGIDNANGLFLLEFWNRSLRVIGSVDRTAPGPGWTWNPAIGADGSIAPDPGAPYVVAEPEVELAGTIVRSHGGWNLYRVDPPLRIRHATVGLASDGWMSDFSAYSHFWTPDMRPGEIEVSVGRTAWGGPNVPSTVTVTVGPLHITEWGEPGIASATAREQWTIEGPEPRTLRLPTPAPPFRVEVVVDPTFVPREIDPSLEDERRLGAQISYRFVPATD
jgi:hypothetical protein